MYTSLGPYFIFYFYFLLFLVVPSLPPQPLCTSLVKRGRAGRKGAKPQSMFLVWITCTLLYNLE
jgi:hypothetical protein